MKKSRIALLILALASILIPVGVAQAKVHVKDGAYYQPATKKSPVYGYISVFHGKVNGAYFNVALRDNKGKKCLPTGLYDTGGYVGVSIAAKTNKKPKSSGKYKITAKKNTATPGLKVTVTGKFKSSSKATISAKIKDGNCTGSYKTSSAAYTVGG